MQYMYLRRKGKAKNPGRHPIGMIGVHKLDDGRISVGVLTVHSKDRFEKFKGRQLMFAKIFKDRSALINPGDKLDLELVSLIHPDVFRRLDNADRHQEILTTLIKDEVSAVTK